MGKEHWASFCNYLERPGIRQQYHESICHVGQRQDDHEESDVVQGRHIVLASCCFLIPRRRRLPPLKPKFVKLGHDIFAKYRVAVPYFGKRLGTVSSAVETTKSNAVGAESIRKVNKQIV